MQAVKLLHVFFIFMWVSCLFSMTRMMMGYSIREDVAKFQKKMYLLFDLPSMLLAVSTGIFLLFYNGVNFKAGWLHMKLTFAFFLILCDIFAGIQIFRLCKGFVQRKGMYTILHLLVILFLIGVLAAIYILKPRMS